MSVEAPVSRNVAEQPQPDIPIVAFLCGKSTQSREIVQFRAETKSPEAVPSLCGVGVPSACFHRPFVRRSGETESVLGTVTRDTQRT